MEDRELILVQSQRVNLMGILCVVRFLCKAGIHWEWVGPCHGGDRGQRTRRELCWLRMEEPGGEASRLSWLDEQEFGFYPVSVWKPLEGLIQE